MTFKKINEATAVSSDGILVRFSRTSLMYRHGDRTVGMEVEHGAGTPMVIYLKTIQSYPPGKAEPVEPNEKAVVRARVEEAMRSLGVSFEMVE